jgi:transcriptional regulator with XRE-family HTH domain
MNVYRKGDMPKTFKSGRVKRLPEDVRQQLIAARREHGWSQAELAKRLGMPQMHISHIETGKVVPRFDTILDLARILDRDFVMVPRALVPAVQSLVRDSHASAADEGESPLYAAEDPEAGDED